MVYDGKHILVATGSGEPWADNVAEVSVDQIGAGGEDQHRRPRLTILQACSRKTCLII